MKKIKLALHLQILIGLALGLVFGLLLPDYAHTIKWLGDIFLRALKMITIPIVFTSIVTGILGIGKSAELGRLTFKTLGFYISTTAIAVVLGLFLVVIISPGVGMTNLVPSQDDIIITEAPSFITQIVNIVPDNIIKAMSEGNMLSVIFFSVLLGFFITRIDREAGNTLSNFFDAAYKAIMKMTMFIIRFAPIGIFAIVSNTIARQSGELVAVFGSLGKYTLVVWIGCAIHGGLILPSIVFFLGKANPWKHIKMMSSAILTAFSTCSSAAALPISLRDTEQKVGVSNKIASFTLPLGATINMNGTALYEAVTVLFIAQVYGLDLSLWQQIIVALTAILAAIGAAGIPMAGLVMLSVVLQAVGLPLEGIGLVLAVQQLCDMPRTAVNSYGDMCAAVVIAKSEGEKLNV